MRDWQLLQSGQPDEAGRLSAVDLAGRVAAAPRWRRRLRSVRPTAGHQAIGNGRRAFASSAPGVGRVLPGGRLSSDAIAEVVVRCLRRIGKPRSFAAHAAETGRTNSGMSTNASLKSGFAGRLAAYRRCCSRLRTDCSNAARSCGLTSPGSAPSRIWTRPAGAASIGFHIRHAAGSLDRLFTYARGGAALAGSARLARGGGGARPLARHRRHAAGGVRRGGRARARNSCESRAKPPFWTGEPSDAPGCRPRCSASFFMPPSTRSGTSGRS